MRQSQAYGHSAAPAAVSGKYRDSRRKKTAPTIYDYHHITISSRPIDVSEFLIEKQPKFKQCTIACQTPDFKPVPYIVEPPPKTGVDVSTQVDVDEVFDFNEEVAPLLHVIVSKTIEQSLEEVSNEDAIQTLLQLKATGEQRERKELESQKAIEESAAETYNKLQVIRACESERVDQATEKLVLQALDETMKLLYSQVELECMNRLDDEGYFPSLSRRAVEEQFVPWLRQQLDQKKRGIELARQMVDETLRSALESGPTFLDQDVEPESTHSVVTTSAKRQLRLCVNNSESESTEPQNIPYIDVLPSDTIADVEDRIVEWLEASGKEVDKLPPGQLLSLALGIEGDPLDPLQTIEELNKSSIDILLQK